MKRCHKCNINVGGNHEFCPLCQNRLMGDSSMSYFAPMGDLKKRLLAYKIQLFISIVALCITIILDVLIGLNGGLHWSYIVALWIIASQIVIGMLMRKHQGIIFYFVDISVASIICVTLSGYYVGAGNLCLSYIVPGIIMAAIVSEFVMCLADKNNVVMPYFLVGNLVSIIFSLVIKNINGINPLLWKINILVDLLMIVGIIIFGGRRVTLEIKKRFHM